MTRPPWWALGVIVPLVLYASGRIVQAQADYSSHKAQNAADIARIDEGQRDTARRLERIERKLDLLLTPCPIGGPK